MWYRVFKTCKKIQQKKNSKGLKIINIGRFTKQKDQLTLLKAAIYLKDKINFELLILGKGTEENNLKKYIDQNKLGKNVYVKVPVVNSKNEFTGKVIKYLNNRNIKLNITAVYTAKQTAKILKNINKKTKVIISIFAGRAGDTGKDPLPEFVESIKKAKRFKNVEILWASVREPYNYVQAKQLGCHIITIPPSIIEKIQKFGKSFDQLTRETVKAFLVDSKKSQFKI